MFTWGRPLLSALISLLFHGSRQASLSRLLKREHACITAPQTEFTHHHAIHMGFVKTLSHAHNTGLHSLSDTFTHQDPQENQQSSELQLYTASVMRYSKFNFIYSLKLHRCALQQQTSQWSTITSRLPLLPLSLCYAFKEKL